jgi:ferredoxin
LIGAGIRVVAPARAADGGVDYLEVTRFEECALGAEMPRRSLRSAFQPATEPLFAWNRTGGRLFLTPAEANGPQVVLGARPCDAAGAAILDKVMGWDYRDEFWFARREATTVLTVECAEPGPTCFCEAVGLAPDSDAGSDVLLRDAPGGYRAEAITPKGEAFMEAHARWFGEAPSAASEPARTRQAPLPLDAMRGWLAEHFEDDLWRDVALRCLGCGACTSICPTCHCFDIVDEPEGASAGTRRRNWDTCQAGIFTAHTSGHNPRADQTARCRQRVMHKFLVYPQRFGAVLCTGCGRCARACPAGVLLPEILETIAGRCRQAAPSGDLA